jgi:hypothetical protein
MLSRISAYSVTPSARIRSMDFFAFQDEASYSLPTASRPVGPMLPRVLGLENFLSISRPSKVSAAGQGAAPWCVLRGTDLGAQKSRCESLNSRSSALTRR